MKSLINNLEITDDSNICINYLLSNNMIHHYSDETINKINNSSLINKLRKIISSKNGITYKLEEEQYIKNIHNKNDPPLIYILFLLLHKNNLLDDITINKEYFEKHDIISFINWYNENQMDLNMNHIKNKIKKKNNLLEHIDKLIFNPSDVNRKPLHDMLYFNPFIPINVQHNAEYNELIYKKYILNNGSIINIYSNKKSHNINIDLIIKIFDIFYKITNKKNKIYLTIYLSNIKKKIYEYDYQHHHKLLKPININSGSTMKNINISLWRYEEIYKVLIHELIHYFSVDFGFETDGYNKAEEHIQKIININGEDRLFESYTETMANIIHCCLLEKITQINITKLLELEISFSLLQIGKILNYYGMESYRDIFNKSKNKINQSTSVLSYFIIKGSLLFKLDEFIDFTKENIIFGEKLDDYLDLINNTIYDIRYIEHIDYFINTINNCKNEFIKNTLRMTCIQIK
jgi:hypothetical protein